MALPHGTRSSWPHPTPTTNTHHPLPTTGVPRRRVGRQVAPAGLLPLRRQPLRYLPRRQAAPAPTRRLLARAPPPGPFGRQSVGSLICMCLGGAFKASSNSYNSTPPNNNQQPRHPQPNSATARCRRTRSTSSPTGASARCRPRWVGGDTYPFPCRCRSPFPCINVLTHAHNKTKSIRPQ